MFDSVLSQRWNNIELILVNDGSTDGTREIILTYEAKFLTRGFTPVIVDQENKGRAAAVKRGLMCTTGEYICVPDCDDILDPEYVSAMAELLMENKEYDCVVCDLSNMIYDYESADCLKRDPGYGHNATEYPYKLLESLLLGRKNFCLCSLLCKATFLKSSCRLESFVTEPKVSQEIPIWIPLALNHARVLACHRTLYHYNAPSIRGGERSQFTSKESFARYLDDVEDLKKKVFKQQSVDDEYEGLRAVLSCYSMQNFLLIHDNIYEDKYAEEMLERINDTHLLDCIIRPEQVYGVNAAVLLRYFSNHVIGYPTGRVNISRRSGGRIIAYAAFGAASSHIRSALVRSDICPDVFWDIAAKPGDHVSGVPVTQPAFKSLGANDTVLVLLQNILTARQVKAELVQTAAADNIWYYYDVLDYLADYYFACKDKALSVECVYG